MSLIFPGSPFGGALLLDMTQLYDYSIIPKQLCSVYITYDILSYYCLTYCRETTRFYVVMILIILVFYMSNLSKLQLLTDVPDLATWKSASVFHRKGSTKGRILAFVILTYFHGSLPQCLCHKVFGQYACCDF